MELETLSQRLSPEFGPALDVLRSIREQEADYHRYLSRLDYLRTQATIEGQNRRTKAKLEAAEQELLKKNEALLEKDLALLEQQQALLEQQQALEAELLERQRLQALLLKAGVLP